MGCGASQVIPHEKIPKGDVNEEAEIMIEENPIKYENKIRELSQQIDLLKEELIRSNMPPAPLKSDGDSSRPVLHDIHSLHKDQIIGVKDQEILSMRAEIKNQKALMRRKTKTFRNQINEIKQLSALRVVELRQEIIRLKEEKNKLTEQLSREENSHSSSTQEASKSPNKLVLTLSQTLTEERDKLQSMERLLVEKDNLLEQLQNQVFSQAGRGHNKHSSGMSPLCSSPLRGISGYSRDSGIEHDDPPLPLANDMDWLKQMDLLEDEKDCTTTSSTNNTIITMVLPSKPSSLLALREREILPICQNPQLTLENSFDGTSQSSEGDSVGTAERQPLHLKEQFKRANSIILDPYKEETINHLLNEPE